MDSCVSNTTITIYDIPTAVRKSSGWEWGEGRRSSTVVSASPEIPRAQLEEGCKPRTEIWWSWAMITCKTFNTHYLSVFVNKIIQFAF